MPLGVAVTVCELPSAKVPAPLTVPSAVGEAVTESLYCFGLTTSVATRVVFPWLLVVLLKPILPVWVPGPRLRALEFTVNVMDFAVVVTVPDADEAVSQLGVVIEYFTLPPVALS